MLHFWTEEELDWLREHYKKYTIREMLPKFNEHFNVDVNEDQLKGTLGRYKIRSGRTGHFKAGKEPWNKGMKGINFGGENGKKTQFKKGQRPLNYKPVGSERIDKDGYVVIKVRDDGRYQDRWKLKQRVIWEKANGPIPDNHTILFADGNKENFDLDNLVMVSRKQLAQLNKRGFVVGDPELLRVGINLVDLDFKINDIEVRGGDVEAFKKYERIAESNGRKNVL